MSWTDPILPEIETFMVAHSIKPTTFGKLAAGDPQFVFELRRGRELRRSLRERVRSFMITFKAPDRSARSEGAAA